MAAVDLSGMFFFLMDIHNGRGGSQLKDHPARFAVKQTLTGATAGLRNAAF